MWILIYSIFGQYIVYCETAQKQIFEKSLIFMNFAEHNAILHIIFGEEVGYK